MSNHLSVATVTAAIGTAVQNALNADVPGASVQHGRPSADNGNDSPARVGIFLYQVLPNAALRNRALPWRGPDGRLRGPIESPLDLNYVFSFHGDGAAFVPERLLASTVRALERTPILSEAALRQAAEDHPDELALSDLWRAAETVRLTPLPLTLEELSKLWSVFFQIPYALSVAYQASVVVVEPEERGGAPLPVSRPQIGVIALGGLRLERAEAADGPRRAIIWGGTLRILGRGLAAQGLRLELGGRTADLTTATVTDREVLLPLTAAVFGTPLPAGILPLRAVLPAPEGMPAAAGRSSGTLAVTLRPRVTFPANPVTLTPASAAAPAGEPASGTLRLSVSPPVAEGQRVIVLLDRLGGATRAIDVILPDVPDPPAASPYPLSTLEATFEDLPRGDWLVRLRVDGVESALDLDPDPDSATYNEILGPEVTVP